MHKIYVFARQTISNFYQAIIFIVTQMDKFKEYSPQESNHEEQIDDDFYIAQEIHRNNCQQYSQSRSEIQEQIAQLPAHEQFDISSFAESRNTTEVPIKNIREKFPFSNAPTLNLGLKKQKFHQDQIQSKNEEKQGFNDPVVTSLLKRISELQEENQSLRSKLEDNDCQFEKFIKKIKEMNEEKIILEQKVLKNESLIKEMQNMKTIMKGYKQKYQELAQKLKTSRAVPGMKSGGGSRFVGEYRAPEETEFQVLSPQLMSPEECVRMFSELTLKLEKSTRIHKKLGRDQKIREILTKILKAQ